MPKWRCGLLAVTCALAVACSGGGSSTAPSPTAPTPTTPTPQTVTVISADTQAPVANAAVRAGGQQLTTGADGTATFINLASNAEVSIEAAGFISPRRTRFNGTPLTLIPDSLPFYELVYRSTDGSGHGYLIRWEGESGREVPFYLPPDMQNDPAVVRAHEDAIRIINAAQSQIRFQLTDLVSAPCRAALVPSDGILASVSVDHDRSRGILGCTVNYREDSATRVNRITHELGHVYGLFHSTTPGMMSITRNTGLEFSPPEKAVMRLMLARHSGNVPPDADSTISGTMSVSGPRTLTIID